MTTRERLARMDEINAHNEAKVAEYIEKQCVETMHRTIEIYARAAFEAMDNLAGRDTARRSELIELLYSTMVAMEQTREQEV